MNSKLTAICKFTHKLPLPEDYYNGYKTELVALPDNIIIFNRDNLKDLQQKAFSNRSHRRFVLLINLETKGEVIIDNAAFALETMQSMLIFPFQFHHYLNLEKESLNWLFITFEHIQAEYLEGLRSQIINLQQKHLRNLGEILETHKSLLKNKNKGGNHLMLQVGFFLELLINSVSTKTASISQSSESKLISKINKHLFSDLSNNLGVISLADHLNIAESTLRQKFLQSYGTTLGDYIKDFKLNRAKQLLKQSSMSVYEIAIECGYSSAPSFCRAFKSQTKISPKQFRTSK